MTGVSHPRVGLIGYGAMGAAFAERLVGSGVAPLVFDVTPAATQRAETAGLEVASSAAQAAERCDRLLVIVRSDDDVRSAVLGAAGILEGARDGAVVVLHPTVAPETTFEVAAALSERGARALDSCPTGVPSVVREGGAVFLTGGDDGLVDEVRPLLLRIGKQVLHLGPLGAGNVGKLVKNLVTGAERLIVFEALQIGEAMGLDYVRTLEMLHEVTAGRTLIDRWELVFDPSGATSTPRPGATLFDKDIPLALELACRLNLEVPVTAAVERSGKFLFGLE